MVEPLGALETLRLDCVSGGMVHLALLGFLWCLHDGRLAGGTVSFKNRAELFPLGELWLSRATEILLSDCGLAAQ